jgi:hypothetical protein
LLQSTATPREASVHLQTLGHDEATPTSKITANVVVIRNCILLFQSAKIKTNLFNQQYMLFNHCYQGIHILHSYFALYKTTLLIQL